MHRPIDSPLQVIQTPFDLDVFYRGPSLRAGPLPSIFYFALSGQESLSLPPFNQPVDVWEKAGLRVFSMDLPGHGADLDSVQAMHAWIQGLKEDPYFIEKFITKCGQIIRYFINQNILQPSHIGAAGLSRGGFAATLLAAAEPSISTLLGFAPLTDLSFLQEYQKNAISPLASHRLSALAEALTDKHIAYYIGNRDTRVSTEACFHSVQAFTEAAYNKGMRSPQISLHLFPSIGHKGHGTPPEIFAEGAQWMAQKLKPA
jgi:esterase FrsA